MERAPAPWGRRLCAVTENRASGGYRVFSLLDPEGPVPAPGQFYMLATERHWDQRDERPFLPRAFSVADAEPGRLDFLVGGGIGIAPLALLRRRFAAAGVATRVLLGFRDAAHSGGLDDLFACCEVCLASEDGHIGQRGYVTELLAAMLAGDDAGSAAVYACGPPAMLDAVAVLCAERGVAHELAMEAPMACGFGACYGCAVPKPGGGYMRLCVDGPVVRGA